MEGGKQSHTQEGVWHTARVWRMGRGVADR